MSPSARKTAAIALQRTLVTLEARAVEYAERDRPGVHRARLRQIEAVRKELAEVRGETTR